MVPKGSDDNRVPGGASKWPIFDMSETPDL
jgi:hypothetical protein